MIRTLLLILTFSICNDIYSQEIELSGKYAASFLGGEVIEFKGTDSFYFHSFYCSQGAYGKGTCAIRGNYLYLNFENRKFNTDKSSALYTLSKQPAQDGGTASIQIKDTADYPFFDGMIEAFNVFGQKSYHQVNSFGKQSLRFQKTDYPVTIKTMYINYEMTTIRLDSMANHTITLQLIPSSLLAQGEVYVYELGEVTEDCIEMRHKGPKEPFRLYKRKK